MKASVIIPTRNRARLLDDCLRSLVGQTLPADQFEVIVVDNGSSDATAEVAERYASRLQLRREFLAEPGLHVGRHAGMRLALSDVLVFGDDDIIAARSWLSSIVDVFGDPRVALVGGNNLPLFEQAPPAWLLRWWEAGSFRGRALPHLSILDFGEGRFDIPPRWVWGCNFSIRRHVLDSAGGFHPDALPQSHLRWRGDGETHVSDWIQLRGLRAVFDSGASVRHRVSAARMTPEYVVARSHAQGISDSYTDLRAASHGARAAWARYKRLLRVGLQRARLGVTAASDATGSELRRIRLEALAAWRAGYDFHQGEVRKDPSLLAWVRQEDYL